MVDQTENNFWHSEARIEETKKFIKDIYGNRKVYRRSIWDQVCLLFANPIYISQFKYFPISSPFCFISISCSFDLHLQSISIEKDREMRSLNDAWMNTLDENPRWELDNESRLLSVSIIHQSHLHNRLHINDKKEDFRYWTFVCQWYDGANMLKKENFLHSP